jgi:hypothetical protein
LALPDTKDAHRRADRVQQEISGSPSGLPVQLHWEGVSSPSQWLRLEPRLSGWGSNLRTALKGGVSNRS